MRPRAEGRSLEVLRGLREQAWFPFSEEPAYSSAPLPLALYLHALAHRYLTCDGQRLMLRSHSLGGRSDLPERVAHWRWLSLRLPQDLLIAALHATRTDEPPSNNVDLGTPHLREVLSSPVAETHLHAGAAFTFSQLWAFWMGWFTRAAPPLTRMRDDDQYPFGSAKSFVTQLFSAATVRLLLASFLKQRDQLGSTQDFAQFCGGGLWHLAERVAWPMGPGDFYAESRRAIRRVVVGTAEQTLAVARRLYGALAGTPHGVPRNREELHRGDPLSHWFAPQPGESLPEPRFVRRGLSYLLEEGRTDDTFATVFWQYQRVRCTAHAFLVEEPGTAGLDWFQTHYRRLSALRGSFDEHLHESAIELDSEGLNLASLEVRTTPSSHWYELREEVRRLARSGSSRPNQPQRGLILHFIKERENLNCRGHRPRLHADPSGSSTGFRFGAWFLDRRRQANAIKFALEKNPEILLLLRGLDVASAELASPTWVTLPLLESLRADSERAAAVLRGRQPHWNVPPLRMTYHAGEEFRRLGEGLRRVHELFDFGLMRPGDRIGHGLVLGIHPAAWAAQAPRVVQSAEERLDDLVWELDLYGSGHLAADGARVERARTEALSLGQQIHATKTLRIEELIRARRLRHQPDMLARLGFPFRFRPPTQGDDALNLVWQHLTDVGVFHRGQRPIEVRVDEREVAFLEQVKHWLRAMLRHQEITIETNPSSNLLISNMVGLEDHPTLSLGQAPVQAQPEQDTVPLLLSINSDDPITFATSLADEFAYIYFAMLRSGRTTGDALRAIDTLRANGWRSRFTLPASTDPQALLALESPLRQTRSRRAEAALRELRGT
ncbi:MAG: hypothetical protein ABW123_07660 [Cystobacter sp.]